MSRSGVMGPLVRTGTVPTALSRNHHICWIGEQGFGNQLLADVRSVRVRSVNKVDTQLHGVAKHAQGRLTVLGRSQNPSAGRARGPKPEGRTQKSAPQINPP